MIDIKPAREQGIVVAVPGKRESEKRIEEFLHELSFLAETLGIETTRTFVQRLEKPDTRTFVGKGKLEEIKAYVIHQKTDVVVFDDDLSPSQLRNLEKKLEVKIYDRSLLILDIFLKRAGTAQAKTQVELARFQYLLPRLTRMWTHLERQRGGTGTRGGAGEKEIETDRRIIRDRISLLKNQLTKVERQASTRRKSREGMVRVALVGYTNAGKSTLMHTLSGEEVYTRDELFATLDSTVRKVVINNVPFLLSDTVGFIRKLPHNLIASFKSTLAEVREADLLLHVIDIGNRAYEDHIRVVEDTLAEMNSAEIPSIMVYNKADKLDAMELPPPEKQPGTDKVFISAKTHGNINELKNLIFERVKEKHQATYPHYPSG